MQAGDGAQLGIVFHRPRPRFLRVVDDQRNPIPGVKVKSYLFWSDSNHCGSLAPDHFLGEGMSDQEGRVRVPDGDFEHAFLVSKPLFVLRNAEGHGRNPPHLITRLMAEETTVPMHRWRRRPLEMRVARDQKPVAGQVLLGRLSGCPCGTCSGPLAETDPEGRIRLSDFYPEKYDEVFFQDAAAVRIWDADPTEWPGTGVVNVELERGVGMEQTR